MVCREGGVICVPNFSKDNIKLCLEPKLKCNGEDDCLNGIDEENCPLSLSPGLQALIVIVVIGVIAAVPVIYIIVKRKQGKPVIPPSIRPTVERIMPCCISNKEVDRSSQQLTQLNHTSDSRSSTDKDVFSNAAFSGRASPPAAAHSTHAVTGRPLNKFKQAAQDHELDRAPSYRDWQANRLQVPNSENETQFMKPDGQPNGRDDRQRGGGQSYGRNGGQPYGQNDGQPNGRDDRQRGGRHSYGRNGGQPYGQNDGQPNGRDDRQRGGRHSYGRNGGQPYGRNDIEPHGRVGGEREGRMVHTVEMNNTGPEHYERHLGSNITYAPSAQRYSPRQHAPYAISSSDGRSNHESKSHLQSADSVNQPEWRQHVARNPNQYQMRESKDTAPPDYSTYASVSSAVPPQQLRQALEKVAVSAPYSSYNRGDDPSHNTDV